MLSPCSLRKRITTFVQGTFTPPFLQLPPIIPSYTPANSNPLLTTYSSFLTTSTYQLSNSLLLLITPSCFLQLLPKGQDSQGNGRKAVVTYKHIQDGLGNFRPSIYIDMYM